MTKTSFIAKQHQQNRSSLIPSVENKSGKDLINLGIGDIDLNTHPLVIADAFNDAKNGFTHYTNPMGDIELRKEIIKYHKEEFKNYEFDIDQVFVVSGGFHGIYLLFKTILEPKDEVMVIKPFFSAYLNQIELNGGVPVLIDTYSESNYDISIEELEKKISPKTKAILINSPSNPLGKIYSEENMREIAIFAEKYDLLIIADDIYDFYSFKIDFTPIYTIEKIKERTVSICSFSKNFAMTGWRVGYCIGPAEIIKTMSTLNENITYCTSSISQRGALSALRNIKKIKESTIPIFESRIKFMCEELRKIPKLKFYQPDGGIYIFIDVTETGLNGKEFSEQLLEKYGVAGLNGEVFGDKNSIRIACTIEETSLKEACIRINDFIESLSL
jgi:aspartate/methionine/tyrosine aminotransferase